MPRLSGRLRSQVRLLLVSADYLVSDFIIDDEPPVLRFCPPWPRRCCTWSASPRRTAPDMPE